MGKNSYLSFMLVKCALPQDRLQAQGWILEKDNETVTSGLCFSDTMPLLESFAPLFG